MAMQRQEIHCHAVTEVLGVGIDSSCVRRDRVKEDNVVTEDKAARLVASSISWGGIVMSKPMITVGLDEYEGMLRLASVVREMLGKHGGSYSGNQESVMQWMVDLKAVFDELPPDLPYEMLLDEVAGEHQT